MDLTLEKQTYRWILPWISTNLVLFAIAHTKVLFVVTQIEIEVDRPGNGCLNIWKVKNTLSVASVTIIICLEIFPFLPPIESWSLIFSDFSSVLSQSGIIFKKFCSSAFTADHPKSKELNTLFVSIHFTCDAVYFKLRKCLQTSDTFNFQKCTRMHIMQSCHRQMQERQSYWKSLSEIIPSSSSLTKLIDMTFL